MAENPIKSPLPADLPTDWAIGQTVGPNGADVGLSRQHGYNYLCEQLNAAQNALNDVGTAFGKLAALDESGKVPETELPSLSFLPLAGGTMQGEIAMGGSAITDLPKPVEDSSPVRKQDTFLKPQLLSAETAAKLGLKAVVLKNLLPDSSFENGGEGWTGPESTGLINYIGTPFSYGGSESVTRTGDKCLEFQTRNVMSGEIATGGVADLNIVPGHTYYFGFYTRGFTNNKLSYQVALGSAFSEAASSSLLAPETWTRCSHIFAVPATRAVILPEFMFKVTEAYENAVDDMMLIDLTEAFGAGKEPGKAWCDENIPYFEDSYAIEEPTVDEALNSILFKLNFSVDNIFSQLSPKFSITSIEYIGNGDTSKTFTVPGKPLAIFISQHGQNASRVVSTFRGMTNVLYGPSTQGGSVAWEGRSVSISGNVAYAGNYDNETYTATIIFEVMDLTSEVALTVVDANGAPIKGALVDGIYSKYGDKLVTDGSGYVKGFALEGDTVTITADYADLEPLIFTVPNVPSGGLSLTKTMPYAASGTVKEFTRSATLKVRKTRSVQLCIVGGGTGGTGGYGATGYYVAGPGGSGGGPGKALTVSATLTANTGYDLVCGAGGLGGAGGYPGTSISSGTTPGAAGSVGGATRFSNWSSENGDTATNTFYNSVIRAGGRGGDGAYNSGSGSAGSNGSGGKGGSGISVQESSSSGGTGQAGTRGGGGGGGGGASESNKGVVGGHSGGSGGRGGDGALLIRF